MASVIVKELEELIETRFWLEGIAFRESIANGDDIWEKKLLLAFHRLSETLRWADATSYSVHSHWKTMHRAYHMALIGPCGSRWLTVYCGRLYDLARRHRQLAISAAYQQRNELDEHREIMDLAFAGDADAVVSALAAHYRRTAGTVLTISAAVGRQH